MICGNLLQHNPEVHLLSLTQSCVHRPLIWTSFQVGTMQYPFTGTEINESKYTRHKYLYDKPLSWYTLSVLIKQSLCCKEDTSSCSRFST